jgi:uncharacterized protein (DUF305 family)
MIFRRLPAVAVLVAGLLGVVTASASAGPAAVTYNDADVMFTGMMIPHHYQALVLSDLVPDRSSDTQVESLASRIHLEQGLEIGTMRGWQGSNGLPKTDPVTSYEEMLADPEMVEEMGLATPEELAELEPLSGNEFDVLFLTLMIKHHEGAIRMLRDVLLHGQDLNLQQQAQDMMSTQRAQVAIMQDMLATKPA